MMAILINLLLLLPLVSSTSLKSSFSLNFIITNFSHHFMCKILGITLRATSLGLWALAGGDLGHRVLKAGKGPGSALWKLDTLGSVVNDCRPMVARPFVDSLMHYYHELYYSNQVFIPY